MIPSHATHVGSPQVAATAEQTLPVRPVDLGSEHLRTEDAPVEQRPEIGSATPPPTADTAASFAAIAALENRAFPAGTIGTRVELSPAPPFERFTGIVARLAADPHMEHVETLAYRADGGVIRITLRQPLRWPVLRALLESAIEQTLAPRQATLRAGVVHIVLPSGE